MFFTLAFFTGELIFADKFQSKDAMTSGWSLITLSGGYGSVLSRFFQKTVYLGEK